MKSDIQTPTAPIAVAIVEDDAGVRQQLVAIFERTSDFACVGDYANGENAVAGLPQRPARVVLVDINLPGIDGVECVRQLAARMPDAQFIMLTVHQDTDTIFEALKAGASGYLLKPGRKDELLQAVRDVVAGGSPMTSSIARKVVQSFQRPLSPPDELQVLSSRERAVLDLLAQGYLYKEIGEQLGISLWTVSTYVHRIYQKLHVTGRIEALAKLRRNPARP
jgi:DNA-binding NarL/FixJ family response regulator